MVLLKDALQTIESYMGINLRSGNISVAQEALNGSQICPVLHHMGGTAVAEHVRAGVPSGSH